MRDATAIRAAVSAAAATAGPGTEARPLGDVALLHDAALLGDAALLRGVRTVVLVEGESDRAAVETLAMRAGLGLAERGVVVVPLGGATNVRRYLQVLARHDVTVTGLCDVAEARFVRRGLVAAGMADAVGDVDLARSGFFLCDVDLEDELVRALGVGGTEDVLSVHGDLGAFRRFQRQPAQRGRPVAHQLRRFLGTTSGRKALYARRLTEQVRLSQAPAPIAALLDRVA